MKAQKGVHCQLAAWCNASAAIVYIWQSGDSLSRAFLPFQPKPLLLHTSCIRFLRPRLPSLRQPVIGRWRGTQRTTVFVTPNGVVGTWDEGEYLAQHSTYKPTTTTNHEHEHDHNHNNKQQQHQHQHRQPRHVYASYTEYGVYTIPSVSFTPRSMQPAHRNLWNQIAQSQSHW